MRRYLLFALLCSAALNAHALQSLRVGSQLLVIGDSAAKVKALLGNPSTQTKATVSKKTSGSGQVGTRKKTASSSSGKGKKAGGGKSKSTKSKDAKDKGSGETWIYHRDGHTTTFTMVGGKIAHIDDVAR